jgi:integrase
MKAVDVPGRGKGMMASSIKTALRVLRTSLRWAEGQGLIPRCPKFPVVKVPKKRPQPVPAESFERLLGKAADHLTRVYLLAGWLAGLRLSEAFELEWGATDKAPYLDLAQNRITLPAEFAKSDEDQWVPLDPDLREALESLPKQGGKVFNFLNRSGRPLSLGSLSKRVRVLARAAGVKLTMHTLRKGFGCRYAGKVPAQVLQKLMRHQSPITTMAYYANVDAAAEAAVLSDRRNRLRNTPPAEPEKDGERMLGPPPPEREVQNDTYA